MKFLAYDSVNTYNSSFTSGLIHVLKNIIVFFAIFCVILLNTHFMPGLFNKRTLSDVPIIGKIVLSYAMPIEIYPDDQPVIAEVLKNLNENKEVSISQIKEKEKPKVCDISCANSCGYNSKSEAAFGECLTTCNCKYSKNFY